MDSEKREMVRRTLFECLRKETAVSLRNLLGGVIGEIAGTVMNINVGYWPGFV
jgi:hypothetical protein